MEILNADWREVARINEKDVEERNGQEPIYQQRQYEEWNAEDPQAIFPMNPSSSLRRRP
jgi:hypothetical protein